ncbi:hypothetical protein Chor_004230 [Crotalus horridus]
MLNKEVKVFLRGQNLYETLIGMDNSILKVREENLVKYQRTFLGFSAQCHFYDRDLLYQFRINFRRRRRLTELLSESSVRTLSDSPDSPFCLRKLNPEQNASSFLSGTCS